MHCTAGHGRTGFMISSYIWYKKIKEDKSFSPVSIATILENDSLTEEQKYDEIKKNKIILFLMDEIKKYSKSSYYEVFQESHNYTLFLNRMNAFINAYDNLTSSSSFKKPPPSSSSSSKKPSPPVLTSSSSKKSPKKVAFKKQLSYTPLSCKRDIMY